ncbi:SPOR domain-containing protein [Polaribacter pacificus]|nr:SPOR domain-containing protein [Polaribacter pacificus]
MNTKYTCLVLFFSLMLFSCGKKEPKKTIKPPVPKTEIKKEEPKVEVKKDVLVYTVQIAASYNKQSKKHEAIPNVINYNVNPWFKYSLGTYKTYQEARASRRSLLDVYPGAFVQALKNGAPIPIQEALKSTN